MVTSLQIWGCKDFENQSSKNESGMSSLISLLLLRHSWMWSEMCVASPCWKEVNNSVPESYRIGSWKWCKKALPRFPKSPKLVVGNSIYHFAAAPIIILWKSLNLILSSINKFEEHHRWKVIICVLGSLCTFPSNLGMSDGSFVGMGGQAGECLIVSFINFYKSGKFSVAKNEILGGGTEFQCCWKL